MSDDPKLNVPQTDLQHLVRKHNALQHERNILAKWERRVAAWNQVWIAVTIAAFVLHYVRNLDWCSVAFIASGQTVLVLMLWLMNAVKWGFENKRRACEREFQSKLRTSA